MKEKKNMSKKRKLKIKIVEPYQFCVIDGVTQKVGNFRIEPLVYF